MESQKLLLLKSQNNHSEMTYGDNLCLVVTAAEGVHSAAMSGYLRETFILPSFKWLSKSRRTSAPWRYFVCQKNRHILDHELLLLC